MTKDIDFEALARWAESDEPQIRPDAVIEKATDEGRAEVLRMLQEAADTPAEQEAVKAAAGGRPRLGAADEYTPTWRVRVPVSLDRALRARAAKEHRPYSELIREAADEYLRAHPA